MAIGGQHSRSRPAILIVDDELPYLDLFREQLSDEYNVDTAQSTEEADLHMGAGKYDVVLVDYLMPDEVGLEFLIRVKQHFPETKRIMLTGYLNPELLGRARSVANLSDCLVKPVSAAQMRAAIEKAIGSDQT